METDHYLFCNRGYIRLRQGQFAEALQDFERALNLAPDTALYLNNRGAVHELLGNLEQALADCSRAIEIDPNFPYGYASRGSAYFLMGEFNKALADFDKSAELRLNHKFVIAGQAMTQHRLGNTDEAKRLWRTLIEMDARYTDAETLREEYQCADMMVDTAREIIESL